MKYRLLLLFVLVFVCSCLIVPSDAASLAESISGQGGIIVVLGHDPASTMDDIYKKKGYTVQILESDASEVDAARKRIDELKCSTTASVMKWSGKKLPYASGLINAVIVSSDDSQVSDEEILRVLTPRGVLLSKVNRDVPARSDAVGTPASTKGWLMYTKPVPAEIDDWTHYLHDASGNAVAADTQVGPPVNMQWAVDSGQSTRDHDGLASLSSMVSCRGRMFYIYDEGPTSLIHRPPEWNLIARDAFNGVVLWKRSIADWVTHLYFFRSGPTWLPRRLVAVGDRVYATLGLEEPVSSLDAATGRTLFTFRGTKKTEEFIVHDRYLLSVTGDPGKVNREDKDPFFYTEFTIDDKNKVDKQIVACDLDSGKTLWTMDSKNLVDLAPLSLCAHGDKVYYLDSDNIHCVSLKDGKELWKAPFRTKGHFLRSYAPTVIATKGAVLCLINDRLAAFASGNGHLLWEKAGYVGFTSPGDLFVIGDLVWTMPTVATLGALRPKGAKFLGNDGKEFLGIEIMTGKVVKKYDRTKVWPGGHHHRCYRNKATSDYFICGRRGVEFINLKDDSYIHNWWIRGICQYGVMPANGLLYIPPDPCTCFGSIKMNGLLSFTSGDKSFPSEGPLLVKGPAFGKKQVSVPVARPAGDWPTYRHDMRRSGYTAQKVSSELKEGWTVSFDGPISAVTVSGGSVYLSEIDVHKIHCLDSVSGKKKWSYVAGASVDSPPTIYQGLALFGCRDGWVYALRVSDGALAWKFRAAPEERFIVEDGEIESSWPVFGSVLVVDDVVYFAAGRSTYLYRGITLYGLNPLTGKLLHSRVLTSQAVTKARGNSSGGALPSVLSSNGTTITMRAQKFGKNLKAPGKGGAPLLLAKTGFLNQSWFHRENWSVQSGRNAPWGNLIVFNGRKAFAVQNPYTYIKRTPGLWHEGQRGHHHQQYALYEKERFPRGVRFYGQPLKVAPGIKPKPIASTSSKAHSKWGNASASSIEHHDWTHMLPMQVRALVLSGDKLFAAGWRDKESVSQDAEELPGRGLKNAPALYVFSAKDGKATKGYKLPARPVFDGMAVAEEKLFLSLVDGTLVCFRGASRN